MLEQNYSPRFSRRLSWRYWMMPPHTHIHTRSSICNVLQRKKRNVRISEIYIHIYIVSYHAGDSSNAAGPFRWQFAGVPWRCPSKTHTHTKTLKSPVAATFPRSLSCFLRGVAAARTRRRYLHWARRATTRKKKSFSFSFSSSSSSSSRRYRGFSSSFSSLLLRRAAAVFSPLRRRCLCSFTREQAGSHTWAKAVRQAGVLAVRGCPLTLAPR